MQKRPTLAVSIGDPAGIGPELAVRAAVRFKPYADLVLYGPAPFLEDACARFAPDEKIRTVCAGTLSTDDFIPGVDQAVCGLSALAALDRAIADVLSGAADALVTAPMSKRAVNLAGIPFQGHTERIAEACKSASYAMMQSSGNFRVAFVTTHIPLREVAEKLTPKRIAEVIAMLDQTLKNEGIKKPKIAVAAFNPHAGEGGVLGDEEEAIILPAIREVQKQGICAEGPFVPDILFIERFRSHFDGIVSMYHDQGHIPFKMVAFDSGVNSTLGLPVIRTSPDHGTAYDLVKRGESPDKGSFFAAVETALRRISNKS